MNPKSLYKVKEDYPNKIFNQYYLPFSLSEKILLLSYLTVFGAYILSVIMGKRYSLLGLLPVFLFVISYSLYSRKFKKIKNGFEKEKNIILIEEILTKQDKVSRSTEQEGLFLFEINYKNGTETMVVLCKDNSIYLNSFYNRRFYSLKRGNLHQLEKLIKIHITQKSEK